MRLKISYIAVLPALILALGIREWFRRSYHFEWIQKENKTQEKVQDQPSSVATAYKIEDVIARLKQAQSEGLKLGLFVRRMHNPSLPQEKGWVWCSLDEAQMNESLPDDRLHLLMNLNDISAMQKIQGVFDKVISDWSVIKFIDNAPWHTLKRLLVCKPHAELITESWCGISQISNITAVNYDPKQGRMTTPISDKIAYFNAEKSAFQKWKATIGESEAENLYQIFQKNMLEKSKQTNLHEIFGDESKLRLMFMREILQKNDLVPQEPNYLPGLMDAIREYLSKRFDEVKLVQGSYPYRYGKEAITCDYWILRSPKKAAIYPW